MNVQLQFKLNPTDDQQEVIKSANEDERTENLMIDFFISSILAIVVMSFTYKNLLTSILTYYSVRFVYYFCFELILGKTLGKYQTQTKVVNKNEGKPTFLQLIIRNLVRFISISSFVGDDKRPIHDKISNTLVIKDFSHKKIEIKKNLNFVVSIILILGYLGVFLPEKIVLKINGSVLISTYILCLVYYSVMIWKNKK